MVEKQHKTMVHKRRCQAMIDAGIEDPESQAGIYFCTSQCPYDECIAVESSPREIRASSNVVRARELRQAGYSTLQIAYLMNKAQRTIERYLNSNLP